MLVYKQHRFPMFFGLFFNLGEVGLVRFFSDNFPHSRLSGLLGWFEFHFSLSLNCNVNNFIGMRWRLNHDGKN